jgi:hypothetical protein
MTTPRSEQRYFNRIPSSRVVDLLNREQLNLHTISMHSASVLHRRVWAEADLTPVDSGAYCPREGSMRARGPAVTADVLERSRDAQNRHDLDAFLECFDSGYRSEQPVHPDRAFTGQGL